jgi:hypothetical protein
MSTTRSAIVRFAVVLFGLRLAILKMPPRDRRLRHHEGNACARPKTRGMGSHHAAITLVEPCRRHNHGSESQYQESQRLVFKQELADERMQAWRPWPWW